MLADERIGHLDGSVQARYSHVTQEMREELMDGLTRIWGPLSKLAGGCLPAHPWPSSTPY